MDKELVSIIILSYNNVKYYKECLDSILIQNYESMEIIFSDDGSSDFDKKAIEDYININKNKNIVNVIVNYNEKNLGTVKHLNKVMKMSKGEYIKLLAVDDALYEKETISKLVSCLEESGKTMCLGYADIYDIYMNKKIGRKPNNLEVNIIKNGSLQDLYKMICISGGAFPAPSRFYSKDFFVKYGHCDEDYVLLEDKSTLAKAIREGCKIHFIDDVIVRYRDGGISSVGNYNPQLKKDRDTFSNKEILPHLGFRLESNKKEYVVWGTSVKYLDNKERLLTTTFKYFVDSDLYKQNQELDERKIYAPEKILEEDRENIFIVVCSSSYIEIENWLDSNGFKEKENYINVNLLDNI